MDKKIRVLFAGESMYLSISVYKGYDHHSLGRYSESGNYFINALKEDNMDVDYIPTDKVPEEFPWTPEELKKYDVVAVSDVGSNTFLISERTLKGERTPNRLISIEKYVADGGGFLMWGGYTSFTGIGGKGFYKNTPIEKILPVSLMSTDDRVETPEGILPEIKIRNHPILKGMPDKWKGWFLSYNRLIPKKGADVIADIKEYDNDPFLVAWKYQKGRTLASSVDCAYHGAAESFLKWDYSKKLYSNMVKWLAKRLD